MYDNVQLLTNIFGHHITSKDIGQISVSHILSHMHSHVALNYVCLFRFNIHDLFLSMIDDDTGYYRHGNTLTFIHGSVFCNIIYLDKKFKYSTILKEKKSNIKLAHALIVSK